VQKEILFRGFPGPNSHFSEGRANLVLPNCRDGCCRTPVRYCRERCQTAAVSPSRQSDGSSLLRRLILQEPQFVGVATETSRGRRLPIAAMEPNDFEAISPCHAEKARAKQARPAGRADRTRPQRATAQSDWMVDFCRCFTGASRCWLAVCCETEPWIPAGKKRPEDIGGHQVDHAVQATAVSLLESESLLAAHWDEADWAAAKAA